MRSASSRETVASGSTPAAQSATSLSSRHSTLTPSPLRIRSIASTSRIRGTFAITTSSSVRTEAARMGRAPFLFPAGVTVPDSGTPPSITNFCILVRAVEGASKASRERLARVTVMAVRTSRDEAWNLLAEWVRVAFAEAPLPRRRGRDGGLRPQGGRRRGALGRHRPAPRRRLRAPSGHGRRRRPPAHDPGRAAPARRRPGHGRGDRRPRRLPRGAARDAAGQDPLRGRRAQRLPARLRVRPPGGHPRPDARNRSRRSSSSPASPPPSTATTSAKAPRSSASTSTSTSAS